MDQSDQSEINEIDDSFPTNGDGTINSGLEIKSHERDGRQHTVSSNRSKGKADCWK